MDIITTPENRESKAKIVNTKSHKKMIVVGIISIVLIASLSTAAAVVYNNDKKVKKDIAALQYSKEWQQTKLDSYDSFKDYASGSIDDLNAQLNSGAIADAGDGGASAIFSADLTIEGTTTYSPSSFTNDDHKLLLVDVLAKNNAKEDVYFSSSELKVKDKNDYEYNTYSVDGYDSSSDSNKNIDLPGNRTQIDYLSLKPGEQSRGTLVFLITRNVAEVTIRNIDTGKVVKTVKL